jgi:spore germination cell wall hydrolase CwlJ-like protein
MLSGSPSWLESMKAAAAALFDLLPDPTNGATHYLNPETVLRVAGKMPSWYDPAKITTRIGRHEFLRL